MKITGREDSENVSYLVISNEWRHKVEEVF